MKTNQAKKWIDQLVEKILFFMALLSASFIVMVVLVIIERGLSPFFSNNDGLGSVNLLRFLTGIVYLDGPTFASNAYGIGYLIISTLYIALLSLLLAMPVSIFSALFIAKIAPKPLGNTLRTVTEILAAIPSIVYGLFGAGVILDLVYNLSLVVGVQSSAG
ncbi:MAG: hypothetical protein RL379_207, partial [Bacillota bacterium]